MQYFVIRFVFTELLFSLDFLNVQMAGPIYIDTVPVYLNRLPHTVIVYGNTGAGYFRVLDRS